MALEVKNPPAKAGDIRYRFHPWVGLDPLEEGMATHFRILTGESHGQRSHGVAELGTTEAPQHSASGELRLPLHGL